VARKQPRARGALETEILACLAAAGRPLTPAQVQAEIGGGIAYTTVMTTLSRLHDKRALDRRSVGRAYEYSLVGDTQEVRSNIRAHQMLKLLDEEADRAGVLTRFIAELDPADERLLIELIERTADAPADRARETETEAEK
jgi:predicted transcriptional regulator